jgi:hypothetical protein
MQRSESNKREVSSYDELPPAADQKMLKEAGVTYEPAVESDRIDLGEIERLSRQRLWGPVGLLPKRKRDDNDDFDPPLDAVEGL